jgi:arginine-tRNA-protein transferase
LYRPDCPACRACEPLRIDVEQFALSRTHRRVLQRGERELTVEFGEPEVSRERIELYNAHRHGRGLARDDGDIDESGYRAFLADSCCSTLEIRYRHAGRLIGVAICDAGQISLNAVYCYFDPAYSHLSPGTFSILTEVDFCRRWGKKYLYLGLYIAESPHMNYKARFRPHERLIKGEWVRFDRQPTD